MILVLGVFCGLGIQTLHVARATSYLSDSPKTCVNCHVMAPQYATWSHSAHRENATCVDCHVPHDNLPNKLYFKGKDGLRHSTMFALRKEPQVIQIKEEGVEVVQQNCLRCHSDLLTDSKMLRQTDRFHHARQERLCWDCHRETPHGRVRGLASVPHARLPLPENPVPAWLQKALSDQDDLEQEQPHGTNK